MDSIIGHSGKMQTVCRKLKRFMGKSLDTTLMLYTSSHRDGWTHKCLHFISCFSMSLFFSVLLFLSLRFSFSYDRTVLAGIAGMCLAIVTPALFFSKWLRCFTVLFLISSGMQQGRNFLITAGTGLVIFWNIKNTLSNLKELACSLICNLEKKSMSLSFTPFSNYVEMLKWFLEQLKNFTDLAVAKFQTNYKVTTQLDLKGLEEKLLHVGNNLNATANRIVVALDTVSSVSQRVVPVLGVLLLCIVTVQYLRQYQCCKKLDNKFITREFIDYDEKQRAQGKPHVLPLTEEEAKRYLTIPSVHVTLGEGRAILRFSIPIVVNFLAWVLFIGIDALFYWLIVVIKTHLEQVEPFHVPLIMNITEDNTTLRNNIQNNSRNYSYSMALFEMECLPKPRLLVHQSAVPLSLILVVLVFLGLLSSKLSQLRLLVSARFFSNVSDMKVQYLHSKIIKKRMRANQRAQWNPLMTIVRKTSFWFPIFFYHQKGDNVQLM